MRFYKIAIFETEGEGKERKRTKLFTPPSMKDMKSEKYSYSSVNDNGKLMTSALDVYLDIYMYELGTTRTGAMIRISGISREDIAKFTYLPMAEIEVYAGMLGDYFPLAHGTDPNLLMKGTVYWAAGNWEGTNTTLDLMMVPLIGFDPTLAAAEVPNFQFVWQHGQKASEAIKKVLDATYGKTANNPNGYEIKIEVSEDLVWQGTSVVENYTNLNHFSEQLARMTLANFPNTKTSTGVKYTGIRIRVFDKTITVYDRTQKPSGKWTKEKPLVLPFTDLIGQPAWKDHSRLVFKTPMRGDLAIEDWVKLPKYLASPYVITSVGKGQASTEVNDRTLPSKAVNTFDGEFEITSVRHVGQFRQADAGSWVTVFEAQPEFKGTEKGAKAPVLTEMEKKAVPKPEPAPGGGYEPPKEAQGGPIPSSNPANPLNTPPYQPPPQYGP